jgi:glycosyltransferase involved in cell wall biosynthesis
MPIKIDNIDDGLPISVIVPLDKKRRNFFENFVLPLIEANEPNEIIINDDIGSAPKKRNNGFKKSTQPYIFFCDDDIILPANYLQTLYKTLRNNESLKNVKIGYVYTGYQGIVLHPESHPMKGNFKISSGPFDGNRLRRGNYISTMTLIKKEYFPMFDESLKRFQDWDIFLTMYQNGIQGVFISDIQFFAYYLDKGITTNTNSEQEAYNVIARKHGLL